MAITVHDDSSNPTGTLIKLSIPFFIILSVLVCVILKFEFEFKVIM